MVGKSMQENPSTSAANETPRPSRSDKDVIFLAEYPGFNVELSMPSFQCRAFHTELSMPPIALNEETSDDGKIFKI